MRNAVNIIGPIPQRADISKKAINLNQAGGRSVINRSWVKKVWADADSEDDVSSSSLNSDGC